MVHKARKCRGKNDCTVYGLATNSKDFWFYQVDNESNVSFWPLVYFIWLLITIPVEPYTS
jgi:hypothetical protein